MASGPQLPDSRFARPAAARLCGADGQAVLHRFCDAAEPLPALAAGVRRLA